MPDVPSVLLDFEEGEKGSKEKEKSIGRHRKTEPQRREEQDVDFLTNVLSVLLLFDNWENLFLPKCLKNLVKNKENERVTTIGLFERVV